MCIYSNKTIKVDALNVNIGSDVVFNNHGKEMYQIIWNKI